MPPTKGGPLYRVQFVIEYVGPRSISSAMAANLLAPSWNMPFGRPYLFAMRASDLSWQTLLPDTSGTYDSLCMAWDLITTQGTLSGQSCRKLQKLAEDFGPHIQRRAMPMPQITDIDAAVHALIQTKKALDIGFTLSVASRNGAFSERDLWIECTRIGLTFGNGSFDLAVPGHPFPLLSVTPYGNTDAFSLRNVQAQEKHPGVTIGFHLPMSVSPTKSLESCFRVADHLATSLDGIVLDEDDRPLVSLARENIRDNMRQGMALFSSAGMVPGSPAILRLYGVG